MLDAAGTCAQAANEIALGITGNTAFSPLHYIAGKEKYFEGLTAACSSVPGHHNICGDQEPIGVIAYKGNLDEYRNQ
jgi:hypothetical protein